MRKHADCIVSTSTYGEPAPLYVDSFSFTQGLIQNKSHININTIGKRNNFKTTIQR